MHMIVSSVDGADLIDSGVPVRVVVLAVVKFNR